MDPKIDDYIRANRDKYAREAIRDQLIAAGNKATDVDAALERSEDPRAAPTSGLAGLARGLYIVAGILGFLGLGAGLGLSGANGLVTVVAFLVIYLGIGYALMRLVRWATGRWAIRGIWAGLIGLALLPVYIGLAFGTCLGSFAIGNGVR